jgi:glycosyltransferase involved in cell wall biosynthesis
MNIAVYVHSETQERNIQQRLGKAEYSYYFVRKKFMPALRALVRVIEVEDPAAALPVVDAEKTFLFHFGPPQRAPRFCAVPVIIVLAWEFSSIPTAPDPDDGSVEDWRPALRRAGHVITLSSLATEAVRQVVPGIHVTTIASPIDSVLRWPADLAALLGWRSGVRRHKRLSIRGEIHDSRACRISHEVVERAERRDSAGTPAWDGKPRRWSFRRDNPRSVPALVGFYDADAWGAWSRIPSPWLELPWRVDRPCRLRLTVRGIGANVGREIEVELGGDRKRLVLGEGFETVTLDFSPLEDALYLRFSGIEAGQVASAADPRTLGMGLASAWIESGDAAGAEPVEAEAVEPALKSITLDGVVFTSVFNPEDGRKNWEDMVTAFCWAFRDREDATLVLKMSHRNPATFYGRLMVLWSRLHPFRCRIVALHGFLDDAQYAELVAASSFVVNSAYCEGQCMPLMEFMRAGVPAVAPDHSAMRDYIDDTNAYVVRSSREPASWPEDTSHALRTFRWRIDWDSLRQAFIDARLCAMQDPSRYRRLSRTAARFMAQHFGSSAAIHGLRQFLREC